MPPIPLAYASTHDKLCNPRLRGYREAFGMTACGFALHIGVPASTYCALEAMTVSPLAARQGSPPTWRQSARRIAHAFGVSPGALWPDEVSQLHQLRLDQRRAAEAAAVQLATVARAEDSPFVLTWGRELRATIQQLLGTIHPRRRLVLCLRYGLADAKVAPDNRDELTLTEVGARLGVTRERARQIELRALRDLRKPAIVQHFQPFLPPAWRRAPLLLDTCVFRERPRPVDPGAPEVVGVHRECTPPRRFEPRAAQAARAIRDAAELAHGQAPELARKQAHTR